MQENSYVVQHIDLMLYNMFFTTICGLQHSTALNDLLLRAVVIAYEVAALFGTQTLHWFAFRDCPPLLYPTPFGISRLQHATALNDLRLRAVVIAYEVAAPFGTQTLHWFAFREYFFVGGDAHNPTVFSFSIDIHQTLTEHPIVIPRQAIHIPMLSLRYP